jgi:hypothetical protein
MAPTPTRPKDASVSFCPGEQVVGRLTPRPRIDRQTIHVPPLEAGRAIEIGVDIVVGRLAVRDRPGLCAAVVDGDPAVERIVSDSPDSGNRVCDRRQTGAAAIVEDHATGGQDDLPQPVDRPAGTHD